MLKRETQKQLMRDLIARGAETDRPRTPMFTIGATLLLASIALYWLTQS